MFKALISDIIQSNRIKYILRLSLVVTFYDAGNEIKATPFIAANLSD
jgi:hypothetical protein